MSIVDNINIILPEFFLFCSSLVLIILGAFKKESSSSFINFLTIISLIIAALIIISLNKDHFAFNGLFYDDSFTRFMKLIVILSSALILYMSKTYRQNNKIIFYEYPILVIFSVLGMMVMISASDLMTLYIALELQSLSLYVLVAIKKDSSKSAEAGLKYFILGSLSSAVILYGFSMIYAYTGSTNYTEIYNTISEFKKLPFGMMMAVILTLSGLAFKLSAAPFHMWTPDVYEGSPSSTTTILIAAPKIAALAVIIRILNEPFLGVIVIWQQIIAAIAILSMCVGAFTALRQTNIKRLLAFGAIGNIGYALMGIMTASEDGVQALLVFITLYVIMSLGAFAFIMNMQRDGNYIYDINSLSGYANSHPLLAAAFSLILLSMAGIPPLGGFIGKFYIFLAVVEAGYTFLAIIGVIFSVIAAFYYLKIIKIMYIDELLETYPKQVDLRLCSVVIISSLLMMLFLLYAHSYINIINNSVSSVF